MLRFAWLLILIFSTYFANLDFAAEPPLLRFGISTYTEVSKGVRVDDLTDEFPVSDELRVGDIITGYKTLSPLGKKTQVSGAEDLDRIRELLTKGTAIMLFILRQPNDGGVPVETSIEVFPGKLTQRIVVRRPEMELKQTTVMEDRAKVTVFYASDRALNEDGTYSETSDKEKAVRYGICFVSIPPSHRKGELERPFWEMEFLENPEKHVILQDVVQLGKEATMLAISKHFERYANDGKRRLLFYVHGFNVSFDEAARRAGQLKYDLEFPGVCMFYSWPSQGNTRDYVADRDAIDRSSPRLSSCISDLEARQDIDEIIVIAHSMGNRGIVKSLLDLKNGGQGKKIREIVLAAPDLDAENFEEQIAPNILAYYTRTTVYASSKDLALVASRRLSKVNRLGEIIDGRPTVQALNGMDLIDASIVDTSFLNHSYYAESVSIVDDLKELLKGTLLPRANLSLVTGAGGKFWRLTK